MNSNIKNLYNIANKPERTIIGLMSGTSLDGLDIALCNISGNGTKTQVKLINFETIEYSQEIKDEVRKVFAKTEIEFQHLCLLNSWLGSLHAKLVNDTLRKWKLSSSEIDIIASHGQTVFHAPKSLHGLSKFSNSTLQIGDGDHIAVKTGIITISDFRQKHVAAGGEGAPLALYGDYLLFCKENQVRILLNIGGIANFTYLPGTSTSTSNTELAIFSTDTGPGNTLIDLFVNKYFNQSFDSDGNIASKGMISQPLLHQLKQHGFFTQPFPKTTGPESFNFEFVLKCQLNSNTMEILPADLVATLTRFTAETIAEAIQKCSANRELVLDLDKICIYTSGGGNHNSMIMKHLQELLPEDVYGILPMDELGIPGDAKEAVLFAVLANETLCGSQTEIGNNPLIPTVSLGKISFPF